MVIRDLFFEHDAIVTLILLILTDEASQSVKVSKLTTTLSSPFSPKAKKARLTSIPSQTGWICFWLAQSFLYFARQKLPEKHERFNIQELLKCLKSSSKS